MTTQYIQYPASSSGSIPVYSTFSAFPGSATANSLAIAADTGILYEYFSGSWIQVAGPGSILAIGTLDGQAPSANGASIVLNQLYLQSASATAPGLVNLTTQSFAGNKTFTGTIGASNLSGTNSGDVTLAAVGAVPSANGASLTGQVLTLEPADGTHPGLLTSGAQTIGGAKTFTGAISASNLSGTNTGDQTITLTGPITGSGTGTFATSITANAVANASLAQMPTLTLKGNNTGSTANASDLTVAQVQTLLSIPSSSSPLPTLSGGTGISHTYTPGSVIFVDSSGFLNEDHTNFNWDDTNNRLNLGGHLSTAALGISVSGTEVGIDLTSSASNTAMQITNQGAQICAQFTNATNSATQGAAFGGAFSRGITTARLQSLAGDQLCTFSAQGYTGSAFGPGFSAAIAFLATENTTATHNGGEIILATTPNGTLAPVAGLVLGQNQLIQLPAYTTAGVLKNDTSGNVTSLTTTGSGSAVLATSPTLVTPLLGTPTSGVLSNCTGVSLTAGVTGILPIANGGTNASTAATVNVGTSAATASVTMARDSNANSSINNLLEGYATTATAAGTTTLTVSSTYQQFFTGTTTQTVQMPVTSTLVLGQSFSITNNSTGSVTVQSSGSNTIQILASGSTGIFTVISTSGTTAASWSVAYIAAATTATITNWTSYTPTITGAGTITAVQVYFKQIGDSIFVKGTVTPGSPSGTAFTISLPSGYPINTSKISTNSSGSLVGIVPATTTATTSIGTAQTTMAYLFFDGSTTTTVYGALTTTSGVFGATPGNGFLATSKPFTFTFDYPI